ncbi:MAG: glucose 1-dehydrogenase [Dehalococcoidia bacterium]|nr:glucose 1-dehydrogenase [Dehalococcoidia bacterium]
MEDYRELFDLTGRVALVTGASEGIGRGIALGLASAGADLILAARREDMLQEVKSDAAKIGRRAEVCVCDVTNLASIAALKAFSLERFGKVDVLVNNACYSANRPAWLLGESDWDRMVDTGLKGVFFVSQIIGSIMREKGYGKIINLSSTFAKSVYPGAATYSAIKAAVSHLTESLAVEWAPDGIRVNALAPTAIPTPSRAALITPERKAMLIGRIPLGRLGAIEDLIPAAIFLASQASDFVTGHTLFVDGGWVAKG